VWGARDWLLGAFSRNARSMDIVTKNFMFRYASPQQFVDFFRTFYGPVHKAFMALDTDGQNKLEADILELIARYNTATDGTMRVPAEYAEVVVTKA